MDANAFQRYVDQESQRHPINRPIRLTLSESSKVPHNALLPQKIVGTESVCGGFEYRAMCVSAYPRLPLKLFIGCCAALEFVTDRGDARRVCGIVTEARSGASDGSISTYQLVIRDAFAVLEQRVNSRVFRGLTDRDTIAVILDEWQRTNSVLIKAFEYEFAGALPVRKDRPREFTMQYNESDAAFIRRLLKRSGLSWYFKPGQRTRPHQQLPEGLPIHTLVMFCSNDALPVNASGSVRYHRDDATEQRDTITEWAAVRILQPRQTTRFSWDYKNRSGAIFMSTSSTGVVDQGNNGNATAATLDDYLILAPHVGDNHEDLCCVGNLRMKRHDYETKCFHGEGTVRQFCAGEYFALEGHPEIDQHPAPEREFVITELRLLAQNNFPKELAARVSRLCARSLAHGDGATARISEDEIAHALDAGKTRFHMEFTAVRRTTDIVPAFDPRIDVPRPDLQSAVVVGPAHEQVYCDEFGRVKIQFPGMRVTDHAHAQGAGASATPSDSAWVRVASNWAGSESSVCGSLHLPRVGTEVLVAFVGGDPDKPLVISQLFNSAVSTPLGSTGSLPGNRYLSGIKSREIRGTRSNQVRLDDTEGEISAQLASDHGASQLNLGWLTQPRANGQGAPRGEGAELRSDKAVAIRGGQGVLITATPDECANGSMLDRPDLLNLARDLLGLSQQLTKLANAHCHDAQTSDAVASLVDKLVRLHAGSNVAEKTPGGREPIVAINGPAGIAVVSQRSLAIGADDAINLSSRGPTTSTTGDKLAFSADKGITLFANNEGLKAVAAHGEIRCESQDGSLELIAKKVLEIISSTDWINIKSKQGIRLNGNGSELVISADGIHGFTAGTTLFHGSNHDLMGAQARPLDLSVATIPAVANLLNEPQWVEIRLHDQADNPIGGQRFILIDPSGVQHSGQLDDKGFARVEQVRPGMCTVQFPELEFSTEVQSCQR